MPRITIPASEVRKGDLITVGGMQSAIAAVGRSSSYVTLVLRPAEAPYDSVLRIAAGAPITVDRPDPDAELVEAMAEAIYEHDGDQWSAARAALAAYRKHTA